jgi:hypothetical protein
LAIADEVVGDGASLERVALATAVDYPDALAAGPALAATNHPLVLVHPQVVSEPVHAWLRDGAGSIDAIDVIGGTAAVGEAVARDAAIAAR